MKYKNKVEAKRKTVSFDTLIKIFLIVFVDKLFGRFEYSI